MFTVILLNSVLDLMNEEVTRYPRIETSWQLAGYVFPEEGSAIITHILRPPANEIYRNMGTTTLGGGYEAEAMVWLKLAADKLKDQIPANSQGRVKFGYLFCGHSHHNLGLDRYSGHDHQTIRSAVLNDGVDVAVGPLANITHRIEWDNQRGYDHDPYMTSEVVTGIKWHFYYLSSAMSKKGRKSPILIRPLVLEDKYCPLPVPKLAWCFANFELYQKYLYELEAKGLTITRSIRDMDGVLKIQLIIQSPSHDTPLVILTDWDYPKSRPNFRVIQKGEVRTYSDIDLQFKSRSTWPRVLGLTEMAEIIEKERIWR